MSWYEWFIMAISRLRRTTMLMTEKHPNINKPQKRVKLFIPARSKLSNSMRPNTAQKRVWLVSNKLKKYMRLHTFLDTYVNGHNCIVIFVSGVSHLHTWKISSKEYILRDLSHCEIHLLRKDYYLWHFLLPFASTPAISCICRVPSPHNTRVIDSYLWNKKSFIKVISTPLFLKISLFFSKNC